MKSTARHPGVTSVYHIVIYEIPPQKIMALETDHRARRAVGTGPDVVI